MIFTETNLKGAFLIEIEKKTDPRGFFGRSWCVKEMEDYGLNTNHVQSNISFNEYKGTLRGMHFQKAPFQETKLVRCTKGAVYDVIVDLRKDSATYTQWFGVELTENNYKMLYVPEGFAHGYLTLQDQCEVHYMVSEFYQPSYESGVRWNDASFNIRWPSDVISISEKDNRHPNYNI